MSVKHTVYSTTFGGEESFLFLGFDFSSCLTLADEFTFFSGDGIFFFTSSEGEPAFSVIRAKSSCSFSAGVLTVFKPGPSVALVEFSARQRTILYIYIQYKVSLIIISHAMIFWFNFQ